MNSEGQDAQPDHAQESEAYQQHQYDESAVADLLLLASDAAAAASDVAGAASSYDQGFDTASVYGSRRRSLSGRRMSTFSDVSAAGASDADGSAYTSSGRRLSDVSDGTAAWAQDHIERDDGGDHGGTDGAEVEVDTDNDVAVVGGADEEDNSDALRPSEAAGAPAEEEEKEDEAEESTPSEGGVEPAFSSHPHSAEALQVDQPSDHLTGSVMEAGSTDKSQARVVASSTQPLHHSSEAPAEDGVARDAGTIATASDASCSGPPAGRSRRRMQVAAADAKASGGGAAGATTNISMGRVAASVMAQGERLKRAAKAYAHREGIISTIWVLRKVWTEQETAHAPASEDPSAAAAGSCAAVALMSPHSPLAVSSTDGGNSNLNSNSLKSPRTSGRRPSLLLSKSPTLGLAGDPSSSSSSSFHAPGDSKLTWEVIAESGLISYDYARNPRYREAAQLLKEARAAASQ